MKGHPPTRHDPMVPIAADPAPPGEVYLCQVNREVSCAACCGLYNVADATYVRLVSMLGERTADFSRVPRQADAIAAFGRRAQGSFRAGPFADFHHCPFVGLIGQDRRRVGCLLHPLATGNRGVDYRDLSYYGGMACRLYFCPAHTDLSPVIKTVVRDSAAGWYEYGLMITETALLSEVFKAVEAFLGSKLTATDILGRAECRRMVARLMRLKIDWPYRRQPDPGPCNYVFDPRRYPKPAVDYPRSMTATSPFAPLMRELLSSFDSTAQLAHAEAVLADMVGSLARAIVAGRRVRTRTHG